MGIDSINNGTGPTLRPAATPAAAGPTAPKAGAVLGADAYVGKALEKLPAAKVAHSGLLKAVAIAGGVGLVGGAFLVGMVLIGTAAAPLLLVGGPVIAASIIALATSTKKLSGR